MEILNHLPEDQWLALDGLLAFLAVYEDEGRLAAFRQALSHVPLRGGVVVEAGAGLGRLSRMLLEEIQPQKLYLVEENPRAVHLLSSVFQDDPRVQVVQGLIETFLPPEPVDLLVQEFFGPLLYDESLEALHRLPFRPRQVFPNRGRLTLQVLSLEAFQDPVITPEVWALMEDALVSDLLDAGAVPYAPDATVLHWSWEDGLVHHSVDLHGLEGDVLRFAVEVWHDDQKLCDPVRCPNWPFVYTPRKGDRFRFAFTYHEGASETFFRWLD